MRLARLIVTLLSLGGSVAAFSEQADAGPLLLTFEGLADGSPVNNYYAGQAEGDYGINFTPNFQASVSRDQGGTGNFMNNPSGSTIAYFSSGQSGDANLSGSFTGDLSFYYAEAYGTAGAVKIFSGLDGQGSLLASVSLPATFNGFDLWTKETLGFSGAAKSIVFSGAAGYIGFDDVSFENVNILSEPPSYLPLGAGLSMLLAAIYFIRRRSHREVPRQLVP